MKKLLLSTMLCAFSFGLFAQCSITPFASTFVLSPSTVGTSYTLNSNNTYALQHAFYICQGTTVTIQNRPGNDTFYVATGGGLIGSEPNLFRVFLKSGATYNATNTSTATIYWETGATITNYTGPGLPPCPALTISTSLMGPNACGATDVPEQNMITGDVLIVPNPVKDRCTINIYKNSSDVTILVFDIVGNKVKEQHAAANSFKMDAADLIPGIYFVQVWTGGTTIGTVKLVKE
jgi:hypothetical protein